MITRKISSYNIAYLFNMVSLAVELYLPKNKIFRLSTYLIVNLSYKH
jgi:hypothetical protein